MSIISNNDNSKDSLNHKSDGDDTAGGKTPVTSQVKIFQHIKDWGCSPLPPTILATFITALYFRPFQPFPMIFPPVLLFTSYLNLQDFTKESAGLSAAWSGLYLLMAKRRRGKSVNGLSYNKMRNRFFTARSLTRGAATGLAAINCISGGLTYYGFDESVM